jgi:hypothetical protein
MFNIKDFEVLNDNVILKYDKSDKSTILTKKIRTHSGGIVTFDFDLYIDQNTQEIMVDRSLVEVIGAGPKCTLCTPGDMAVIDYTAEDDPSIVLYEDHESKVFFLREKDVVQKEDVGVYNSLGNYSIIYHEGDTTEFSRIYGVIRNEHIICNDAYVVFKFEDLENGYEQSPSGIWFPKNKRGDIITLTIEYAPENCHYKPGDKVALFQGYTFTKQINLNTFLMAYTQDVMATTN